MECHKPFDDVLTEQRVAITADRRFLWREPPISAWGQYLALHSHPIHVCPP